MMYFSFSLKRYPFLEYRARSLLFIANSNKKVHYSQEVLYIISRSYNDNGSFRNE